VQSVSIAKCVQSARTTGVAEAQITVEGGRWKVKRGEMSENKVPKRPNTDQT